MSKDVHWMLHVDAPTTSEKHPHLRHDWVRLATKDMLIEILLHKKWTSRKKTELQKFTVDDLQNRLITALRKDGTLQENQQLAEKVLLAEKAKTDRRSEQFEKNRKRKEQILARGAEMFVLGAVVDVFDETVTEKNGRVGRKYDPIHARVVNVENDSKLITVEFLDTRKWHEAGGHSVHRKQQMKFKFDSVTCKWLREGLTAEVVRSIGPDGRSRYFELKYTRQYLILE